MPVYIVTGKLGAGKSLVAVSRIQEALNKGKKVATNLDLYLEHLIYPFAKKTSVMRTSDIPTVEELEACGLGYDGDFKGDEHNGLMVFDECAKWLNSREYRDPSRKKLVDFMVHLRKRRWDLLLLIQDVQALDKQFRDLFAEHVVYCRRMDRYSVPFLSPVYKLFTGKPLNGIRLHVGIVKYGENESSPIVDRWWYRGNKLFDAYDTEQGFASESDGLRTILPPWYTWGRYHSKWDVYKDDFRRLSKTGFLISGLLLGSAVSYAIAPDPYDIHNSVFSCNKAYEKLIGCDIKPDKLKKILANARSSESAGTDAGETSPPSEEVDSDSSLHDVFISGSVRYDSGQYDYAFVQDGKPVELWKMGWRVYDVSACKAVAVNLDNNKLRKTITCTSGDHL